ncbi:MAG: 50S ribosomal protein L32 [Candidatus Promineifilaceae bacterium]|jgi:large subunit ribosomal protein L32
MGAVPKRRISHTRRAKRRTHDNLATPHLVACSNCGELKRAHFMCPSCRTYGGRQILPEFEE